MTIQRIVDRAGDARSRESLLLRSGLAQSDSQVCQVCQVLRALPSRSSPPADEVPKYAAGSIRYAHCAIRCLLGTLLSRRNPAGDTNFCNITPFHPRPLAHPTSNFQHLLYRVLVYRIIVPDDHAQSSVNLVRDLYGESPILLNCVAAPDHPSCTSPDSAT